jgi:hypothetical protein
LQPKSKIEIQISLFKVPKSDIANRSIKHSALLYLLATLLSTSFFIAKVEILAQCAFYSRFCTSKYHSLGLIYGPAATYAAIFIGLCFFSYRLDRNSNWTG